MDDYTRYLKNLPVIPDVATKIMSIAEDNIDISFRELEDTIKLDPGLAAKILKVANSALYARQKQIRNLQMAITLLGFKNIKNLVLLVTASNMFSKEKSADFYRFYWKHSIVNAFMARDMALRTANRGIAETCFLAGLLHDIGQVALYNADPATYGQVLETAGRERIRISRVEERLFGTNHKRVGGAVLREWNFPDIFVDAAEEHGSASITSRHKQIILFVSVADFFTSNIDLYADAPLDLELMNDVLRQTSLKQEDIEYFASGYLDAIRDDPLFAECENLFSTA